MQSFIYMSSMPQKGLLMSGILCHQRLLTLVHLNELLNMWIFRHPGNVSFISCYVFTLCVCVWGGGDVSVVYSALRFLIICHMLV